MPRQDHDLIKIFYPSAYYTSALGQRWFPFYCINLINNNQWWATPNWLKRETLHVITHLGSNLGKQTGDHDSACLKASEVVTKLKIMWRSTGWRRYFFIWTRAINWPSAISKANTRSWNTIRNKCRQTQTDQNPTRKTEIRHYLDLYIAAYILTVLKSSAC